MSVVLHAAAGVALTVSFDKPPKRAIPIAYEVQVLQPPTPEPKEEVKKVEPPKPKPKPKPKKPEPKPKPKKKKVKVEKKPKPEPKKPEPKPEPPKEKPKPIPEVVEPTPKKAGIQIKRQLPPLLNSWGRLVQRKVEKYWVVPGGIKIDEEDSGALISFWVDREGNLIGPPEIVKHGSDPALGESGVRAIRMAAPLPPLPMEYDEQEQQVVYMFSLVK